MPADLTATVVYLDEGEEAGGIAHPTKDLVAALDRRIDVRETTIQRNRSVDPRYWYRLGANVSRGADVVHVQFEYGSFGDVAGMFLGCMFPVFARGLDAPLVTTLHNFRDRTVSVSLTDPDSVTRFLVENATQFVDRSLVRHTDFFIPLMKSEEELLQRHGVPENRIEHIPLVPETSPEFRDSEACKRELGIGGHRVVTAFGWVRRTKGYDRVVDVLPQLPDDVVFLVAGGTRTDEQAAYLEELRAMVRDRELEKRVKFTGYVDREEHPTIMNATDVMVFPYRDNRASDALARGLAYHLPVVTSANAEFSAFEDEWGCVRTVDDDTELTDSLQTVLEDETERERLRGNAERFTVEMNWDNAAERVVDIYRTVRRSSQR